ncbi:MAG TPA: AAA family ATPase [Ktedonobacteraceae bacterium]|nr:AAA family ATPase [Ktedonobacteraceae bacterium]
MVRTKTATVSTEQRLAIHFGAFLKSLRSRYSIRQADVLAHLPHWTQANYSRVENDEQAPPFDQLAAIYAALSQAGAELTPQDRQQFLTLARVRIAVKKSHLDRKSDHEWEVLRVTLSQFDHRPAALETLTTYQERLLAHPGLMETRHLLGRADWLASVLTTLQTGARKIVVLQGPSGIGKSSELHRIADHFLSAESHPHVVLCVLPNVEQQPEPENTLDSLLGSLLAELGLTNETIQRATRTLRITSALNRLEKTARPALILVDNAEHLMEGRDRFAPCWEDFLERFLRSKHHAVLVLATKEWPGWRRGEGIFVEERMVPAFTVEEGAALLQRIGLAEVPVECLQQASEAVGGIPQCLDWVASLAKEPLWLDAWDELDDLNYQEEGASGETVTRRLLRLLQDRALLSGKMTNKLSRMLERIIIYRLSAEAVQVLNTLSLAPIPLGKPALEKLCPRPSLLKELRTVSLLTAHSQRVQVLPMVAVAVRKRLSPEQQRSIEEQLIEAYQRWLDTGEMSDREMGMIITELTVIYLRQHRLLDAADLLIYYGWLSFNLSHGPRLAHIAEQVIQTFDWRQFPDQQCGGLLLQYILTPFLGRPNEDEKQAVDFQQLLDMVLDRKVTLQPATTMHVIRFLILYEAINFRFEKAQALLESCLSLFEPYQITHPDVQASLLAQYAWILARWSEYLEEQEAIEKVQPMREKAIVLYKQCCTILSTAHEASPLKDRLLRKRLSAYLNYLGYQLTRNGQAAESLPLLEQSIKLGEQGYCNFGALAAAYGDMSQALMELGRLEEALAFDEKALAEAKRCADSGDALSKNELWIYYVNRGRLYLRIGKIEEAEQLLQEAKPHIQSDRNVYRMFAESAIKEIKQRRNQIANKPAT